MTREHKSKEIPVSVTHKFLGIPYYRYTIEPGKSIEAPGGLQKLLWINTSIVRRRANNGVDVDLREKNRFEFFYGLSFPRVINISDSRKHTIVYLSMGKRATLFPKRGRHRVQ